MSILITHKDLHKEKEGLGDLKPHLNFVWENRRIYDIQRIRSIESRFWLKELDEINFIVVFNLRNCPTGQKTQGWKIPVTDLDITGCRLAKERLKTGSSPDN